jgi:polyisoprenoid-binding protein YceI
MRLAALCLLASVVLPSVSRAQEVPVFAITRAESSITFKVKASVAIQGTFDQWDATLTFTSPDVTTGVLDELQFINASKRRTQEVARWPEQVSVTLH